MTNPTKYRSDPDAPPPSRAVLEKWARDPGTTDPETLAKFLDCFSRCGNVSAACRETGISRRTIFRWCRRDPEFAKLYDEALKLGTAGLVDEARRRGYEGVEKPVFYQGEQVATVREYSDTLLMFLLNGLMPETFKRHIEMRGSVAVTPGVDLSRLSEDELVAFRALLDKARPQEALPAPRDEGGEA